MSIIRTVPSLPERKESQETKRQTLTQIQQRALTPRQAMG